MSNNQQHPLRRVLLVTPPNSYRIGAYLRAARCLGVEAIVASPGRHSLVGALSSGLHVDLGDPRALDVLLQAAEEQPFQGVIATDDAAVELTSRIASRLNLSHNPPAAAVLSRRKDLARACLRQSGISVPEHRIIRLEEPLKVQLEDLIYPVVIKPVSLSASRGVIRANNQSACLQAVHRVRRMLMEERGLPAEERQILLIESFVSGPEVAVEGLLYRGEFQLLAIFDKPEPLEGPYFEESYYITPSRHPDADRQAVVNCVIDACRAYGLQEGPVHAEVRIAGTGPCIMEVASRTIGGECARLLTYGSGCDLETLVIKKALGEEVTAQPLAAAAGVLMLPVPSAGVLRRVEGLQQAQRVAGIKEILISVREGYELVPLPEGGSYPGFIFAQGETPAAVESALRESFGKLNMVLAPVFKMKDVRNG